MGKPLENPKEELLAQTFVNHPDKRFNKTQSYLVVNPEAKYDSARSTAPEIFAKPSVQNRIQDIMREKGLTPEYLIGFGQTEFLHGEDKGIGFKAWRTFLELHGLLNSDQGINIANIVFNESVVQSAHSVPDVVVSSTNTDASDNPCAPQSQPIDNEQVTQA